MTDPRAQKLFEIAKQSLLGNIVEIENQKFLVAGQNQFKTLWTRDFCHSIRGLVAIGQQDVACSHAQYLLNHLREDGLVPRVVDNHLVQFRVAWQSARTLLTFLPGLKFQAPLKAQYIDEHGSNAMDSNVLLILGALQLGDQFWQRNESKLKTVWNWYQGKFHGGLLQQSAFSDWQDTTRRQGRTFLMNLLYFLAAARLQKKGWNLDLDLTAYKETLQRTFLRDGVYLSQEGYDVVSVEAHLLALESPEFLSDTEKEQLWLNLKKHPLITLDGAIGRCSYPDWPSKDLAWHIKVAQLKNYHGSITWSWIAGLGLKVARLMKDPAMIQKQLDHLEFLLSEGEVLEVYDPYRNLKPWRSWLLSSEHPFSWGAGYVAEALKS
ncbi:MAG: hypothetical protein ACK5Y2_08680 [Bdellovibrionales bacterium]